MRAKDERTGVLVIRAWTEEDDRVRARLTETIDADEPGWDARGAEGEEAILAAVAAWLREFSER
ncbi:MAG TPA: hypothetical protein VKB43_13825 [Gaiellaceae bacterium]|nr:hypothetical protein [Gaiellaceae bacterium]